MAYILFIIFVALLIALVVTIMQDSQEIDKKKRIGIVLSVMLIIGLGGFYTMLQDKNSQKLFDLQNAFNRGEELHCQIDGEIITIHKQDFEITSGIKSLKGKKDTQYDGLSILLESCTK